ncbi:hypothetical protein BL253_17115 [Pseudofrankia asymbiotica]|uniref:Galactose oxidase n=2 Tax=Pseudofrankia asymbiotica TaxID=1834516 RepID=A0A1V2I9P2_9ACTN|nr:hypothetical protein BL253_17115 [Pseudofrankia asymbiotica]
MTDEQLADLLRRTADRVPANARLTDLVQARVRRARRRRRAGAIASAAVGVAVVLVAVVTLVAGPVRQDSGPRPEPSATGVDAWRWRDLPPRPSLPSRPSTFGDTERTLVVGHSLVVLGRDPAHWTAEVSDPVGVPLGARYPAPDTTWTSATVAVSDTTIYLWGGSVAGAGNGAVHEAGGDLAFDVTTRTWSKLPPAPIEQRTGAVAVWTGAEVVVWGGARDLGPSPKDNHLQAYTDGAAYNPATRTWTRLPPAPVAVGLVPVDAVVVDGKVVIWTHPMVRTSWEPDLAAQRTLVYDPATYQWRVAPGPGLIEYSGGSPLVATSAGAIAVSGSVNQVDAPWNVRLSAARFDVATATWTPLPVPGFPPSLCPSSVVPLRDLATGTTVAAAVPTCGDPQVLDPASGQWVPITDWGADKVLAGVPSSGDAYLTSDKLTAARRPDRPGTQILAP